MSKKILAILMAVAMAFSLLPVTAVAVDGEATPPVTNVTASQDGVKISKEVVTDDNGNHSLVMEAYVEGNTETITSSKPLDIVLVLDVSGSMDDSQGWGTDKKIVSLQSAVNSFIEEVAKKNITQDGNLIGHRISIVKFAGNKSTKIGNDTYTEESGSWPFIKTNTYNYSQIVKSLTDVSTTGKTELQTAVNNLSASGATRSDYGMELAQTALTGLDESRGKVVVMFTDGTPTSESKFENNVASEAISVAKNLKDTGAKVYTVGIFNGANPNADVTNNSTNKENKYMQAVSSNYPDASFEKTQKEKYSWQFGKRANNANYYLTASNKDELSKVFEEISQSITTSEVVADSNAVLQDTLTNQFAFDAGEDGITVQKAKVTGKDSTGNYTWASAEDVTGITKKISGKTVTVTGFDYTSKDNLITEKDGEYSGYKLIVTIPIKVNQDYTGWEAGTKNYDTNTTGDDNKAGLTGYKKGDEAASTLLPTSPQVPVTAYTVTYDWGETAPDGEQVPTDQNTYLEGKTYQVDTNYTSGKEVQDSEGGTYRFSGWSDPSKGVMGTNDVTITGSWTYTEPTPPPAPTYTLTYDANGGHFASEATTTTKEETIAATGDHDLNYTDEYTPTHAQTSEGKNVIFLGWSTEKQEKVFSKDDVADAERTASSIITKVNIQNPTTTVYAVWSLDENNNNIPDIFEATVTYKIENGYWFRSEDGKNIDKNDKNVTITLYEKSGHLWKKIDAKLGDTIPTGHGGEKGYTAQGWYKDSEVDTVNIEAATPVTGNVTYTFKYTNASIPTTYTVVLHLENGAYTTVPDGYTTTSTSGVYQYTVTEPTTIIKPDTTTLSRSGYDFQGWSLSKTDSQTLIEENETFTALYVKQNGLTGNYDKIDLYAVWKKVDPPVDPVKWDVSRSKTATNLDSNYESKVTLSLPSAEEKLESDVVFVLDGSSSAETDVVKESLSLLEELKQAAGEDGAAVNVCIVKFKRQAFKSDWYDLSKDFDAIKTAMETKYSGGTNLHAGLLAGQEALEEHTNVLASRKHLILISDGSTYLYSKDGNWASDTPFTRSYYPKDPYNAAAGGFWDNGVYEPNNYPDVNVPRPKTTSDVATWQKYLKDVEARNKKSHGDDYDYHCNYDLNFNQGKPSEDFKQQPSVERSANNRDMAFYYADQVWQQIKDAGYNAYSIATEDGSAGAGNADDSHCFMNYLNDGKSLNFSEIRNEMIYAVSAGSKVTDTIGEKFTFGSVESFALTVGGSEMKGTVEENTVNFGDVKQDGKYPYTVTYTPDTKTFVWTINENVSNFAPVQLTYTVKLTKPETAASTYGQTDLNGDTFLDGTQTTVDSSKALYTNERATLTPVDSQGDTGAALDFPKPSVSYTIRGGSSGGNGGSSRPSLNTKDHYGYIIGYPVDYYTGQPTTDQTKKPIRPEGKITRAEVATIYFRMLTDESRTKFWSQSNPYPDVKVENWFNNAVSTLSNAGIISGYEDGTFRPNGYITRAEFATIAARFFDATYNGKDLFPDIDGHWAKDYINTAANKGFVNGYEDGTFRPDRNITRAEAVTLVNRTLERHPDQSHFTKDMLVWPDNRDETKWYYADMQEATNSHTYQTKEKSDKTKYEDWTKTLSIRNWEALEKEWSNANSSQGKGNVV